MDRASESKLLPQASQKVSSFTFLRWIVSSSLSCLLIAVVIRYIYNSPTALLFIDRQISAWQGNASDFNLHQHAYLQGIFEPIPHEIYDFPVTIVSGEILPEFDGLYLYNGPNPTMRQLDRGYHFFDGHGFVRLLRLDSQTQRATFSAQYLNTFAYNLSKEYDQNVFVNLGEVVGVVGLLKLLLIQPSLYHALQVTQLQSTTANTAFLHDQHNHRLYATQEAGLPFAFHLNATSLRLVSDGFDSINMTLNYEFPAHTKTDPTDRNIYFYGHSLDSKKTAYKKGVWDRTGITNYQDVDSYYVQAMKQNSSSPTEPVKDESVRSFSHDLLITENYIIILESSVVFDPMKILSTTGEFFFNFDASRPFRIGLAPKVSTSTHTDDTHWITLDRPLSIIHTLNAWEDIDPLTGEKLVLLHSPVSDYFNAFDPRNLSLSNYFELAEIRISLTSNQSSLQYYELSPTYTANHSKSSRRGSSEKQQRPQVEFPSVHPEYVGRRARYGFVGQFEDLTLAASRPGFAQITKVDMLQRLFVSSIVMPEDVTALEPCLIPKPRLNSGDEDYSDAVHIAALAYNHRTREGEFYVFDGASMSSKPLLHLVLAGQRSVNFGFHGLWMSREALMAHYKAYQEDEITHQEESFSDDTIEEGEIVATQWGKSPV